MKIIHGKIKRASVDVTAMIFIGKDLAFAIKNAQEIKQALFTNNKSRIDLLNPIKKQLNTKQAAMMMATP